MIVYVSIGNSDHKLPQTQWADFQDDLLALASRTAKRLHGVWYSPPTSPFQNACVCVEIYPVDADDLKAALGKLATTFRQDSIAWAEAETTFLTGEQEQA